MISLETRNTLLYSQLQEGLRHKIMEAPAVSGAVDYTSLCVAAKSEEKRLPELKKRQQYRKSNNSSNVIKSERTKTQDTSDGGSGRKPPQCWNCNETGHIASERTEPKKGDSRQPVTVLKSSKRGKAPRTRQVQTTDKTQTQRRRENSQAFKRSRSKTRGASHRLCVL